MRLLVVVRLSSSRVFGWTAQVSTSRGDISCISVTMVVGLTNSLAPYHSLHPGCGLIMTWNTSEHGNNWQIPSDKNWRSRIKEFVMDRTGNMCDTRCEIHFLSTCHVVKKLRKFSSMSCWWMQKCITLEWIQHVVWWIQPLSPDAVRTSLVKSGWLTYFVLDCWIIVKSREVWKRWGEHEGDGGTELATDVLHTFRCARSGWFGSQKQIFGFDTVGPNRGETKRP